KLTLTTAELKNFMLPIQMGFEIRETQQQQKGSPLTSWCKPVTCQSDLLQSEKRNSSRKDHHKPPGQQQMMPAGGASSSHPWQQTFSSSMPTFPSVSTAAPPIDQSTNVSFPNSIRMPSCPPPHPASKNNSAGHAFAGAKTTFDRARCRHVLPVAFVKPCHCKTPEKRAIDGLQRATFRRLTIDKRRGQNGLRAVVRGLKKDESVKEKRKKASFVIPFSFFVFI
ncbi:hypothetical protein Tsubulata_033208, partial [Turnera subulata]